MENNNDFIKDWLEGKVSPEELKSKKENGDETVKAFDELITRTSRLKVPENSSNEEAWATLQNRLSSTSSEQVKEAKVVKMNRWIPLSIAASVALMIVAYFGLSTVTVTTNLAETRLYTLPDGSEVTLNADSKITHRRFGWKGDRKVTLEGEAFFDVKKGESFIVETHSGSVSVLGTSFNVLTRASAFEVACFTGKVKVANETSEVLLTKGLSTKLTNQALTTSDGFDDKKTTWRNGDFHFEGQPLNDVINELERQYNVTITFAGDGTRLYSGYFSNKNLDEALEMVFKPMSLTYERRDSNNIIVK